MDNLVKKQHFVPRFYLRFWCIPNTEQVHVYDKEKNENRISNIEDIASERFFYDFDLRNFFPEQLIKELDRQGISIDGRLQTIEHMFSNNLETPFSIIFKNLVEKTRSVTPWIIRNCYFISPEMKEAISVYLAFQLLRTKTVRANLITSSDRLVQQMKDMGIPDEMVEKHKLSPNAAKRIHNKMLLNKEEMFTMGRLFNRLTWVLGINRSTKKFCTSDNPIGIIGHDKTKPPFLGTGLASTAVEVFYPLAPDQILIMVDGNYHKHLVHDERRYIELDSTESIDYYNMALIKQANRCVFACEEII